MVGLPVSKPHAELEDEYWSHARQPLACLLFLLPLLAVYEYGVVLTADEVTNQQLRNGADVWLRTLLGTVGVRHGIVLPALILTALLGWHIVGRFRWRVRMDTLGGMLAESLLFAFLLILVGQLQHRLFQLPEACLMDVTPGLQSPSAIGMDATTRAVIYVGAGIYEEFLFRLCLLPACYGLFRLMKFHRAGSAGLAVLCTSLLFAAAHHIGPHGEPLVANVFAFRAIAGAFFSGLFVLRGFGITVGCHAAYDLLVGLVMATG